MVRTRTDIAGGVAPSSTNHGVHLYPSRSGFPMFRDYLFALKLDVESVSSARTVSEELGQRLSPPTNFECSMLRSVFLVFFKMFL